MTRLRVLVTRMLGAFLGRRREMRLTEEVGAHLDLLVEEHMRRGLTRREATRAANRDFGGVAQVKDAYRDQAVIPLVDEAVRDLRFAVRQLWKNKGFAVAALLTLALGIGANTAIFSVVDAALLRPLPYPQPDRLVIVNEAIPARGDAPVNATHFETWRADTQSFEDMALIGEWTVNLTDAGDPEMVSGARVSPALFAMLGTTMHLGRGFLAQEDLAGSDRVVVLTHGLWQRRFGADPQLVGRVITLDGEPYEVVGILPADFRFPSLRHLYPVSTTAQRPEIWKPFGLRSSERVAIGSFNNICIARLKPGASLVQAQLEMDREQRAISGALPERVELRASVIPLQKEIGRRSRAGLELLLAAVGAVLLIGCINVANLVLVKTLGRQRELAVRRALGANRSRLVRQMFVESVALCGLGGALGVVVAYAAVPMVLLVAPLDVPRLDEVTLDGRALMFTLVVSACVAFVVGLLPALRSTDLPLPDAMKVRHGNTSAGRSAGRARSLLVGAEIALSAACLILAGLFLHSLANLLHVDKGFDTEHIVTTTVNLGRTRYVTLERRAAFVREAIERLNAIPEVAAVGVANQLPLRGVGANSVLSLEGTSVPPLERPVADVRAVNPRYFLAWGIPLKAGRLFDDADRDRRLVIVSEFTAAHAWPGENPIGKRLRLGVNPTGPAYEVVGIVGDARTITLDRAPSFAAYVPYWQRDAFFVSFALRTTADPASLAPAVRTAIHQVDAALPILAIRAMDDVVAESTAERRFQMNLVLLFAAVGVLLAGIGIYGVMSYGVRQRINEIGIRLALGARPQAVRRLVMADALGLVGGGLAVGVPSALATATTLRSLFFGVAPYDLPSVVGACLVVTASGLLAAYLPARWASRVDPAVALRCE